nr:putative acetyltransferase [Quercus suber]
MSDRIAQVSWKSWQRSQKTSRECGVVSCIMLLRQNLWRLDDAVQRHVHGTTALRATLRGGSELSYGESSSITGDKTPLPPPAATEEEDEALFAEDAWVEPPVTVDYGTNVKLGDNVFVNFNCTILDTVSVTIGARTLLASNVSLFSATHPLDPGVRNGTKGPELGGEIHIGEDCWIGGNVTILPNVKIGRASVVGAGSVVTKIRDISRETDAEEQSREAKAAVERDTARLT